MTARILAIADTDENASDQLRVGEDCIDVLVVRAVGEAIDCAHRQDFDLILVDLQAGSEDLQAAVHELREDPHTSRLPALVLTDGDRSLESRVPSAA